MSETHCDDADVIKAQQPQAFPDHWSLFLHCTICFGFFHNPHTLECGHSFCKRCLKRLAEISRDDNPDIRLRRLSVSCPTCRHPFRAKPAIRGRLRTCIVLKHLVDLWKQECKMLLSTSPRHLRSICSQTEEEKSEEEESGTAITTTTPLESKGNNQDQTPCLTSTTTTPVNVCLQEEFLIRLPPGDDYFEAVMRQVSEASQEMDQDLPDDKVNTPPHTTDHSSTADPDRINSRENNNSSSDSESSMSTSSDESSAVMAARGRGGGGGTNGGGGGVGGTGGGMDGAGASPPRQLGSTGSLSNVSIPEFFGHMSISASLFRSCEWFPVRCLLMTVWFVYSLLIVALAETFLPYVMIFTLFFFLIVLK